MAALALPLAVTLVVTLGACNDVGASMDPAPSVDPYASLRLNVRGATMSTVAPYDTLQLSAVGLTASGAAIQGPDTVRYATNDTLVTVSPAGLVTARHATGAGRTTMVIATLHDHATDITHVDTAFIAVTSAVPASPMASFAIVRPAGDSTKLAVKDWIVSLPTATVAVSATAADGSDIRSLLNIRFSTSDSSIAKVSATGEVTGMQRGMATIYATSTYYGVTKRDSVQYQILDPMLAWINAEMVPSKTQAGTFLRQYAPATITISTGGTVIFQTGDGELSMDVVFDDPSAAQPAPAWLTSIVSWIGTGAGNIGPLPLITINGQFNPECNDITLCTGGMRTFTQPGTYPYHSALFGTSGVIIVR